MKPGGDTMATGTGKKLTLPIAETDHRGLKVLAAQRGVNLTDMTREWVLDRFRQESGEVVYSVGGGAAVLADGPRSG
jgi:hypothetical protein